ncbi:MAG TPA: DUF3617 domain-containing protein [Rhizomicrobium sp.]|nr:DUF3617 domain-containing protein [Rhizomicrobium sp.]
MMWNLTQVSSVGAAVIAAAALATSAWAASPAPKPGLWDITTKMDMGSSQMQIPDLSQMPPEVQAQLKKMNITPTSNGIRTQQCITQAEIDRQDLPMAGKDCKMLRSNRTANSFTAEIACNGEISGTGQMEFRFPTPERFSGVTKMRGIAQGMPVSMTSTFDGKWLSASCPKVTN